MAWRRDTTAHTASRASLPHETPAPDRRDPESRSRGTRRRSLGVRNWGQTRAWNWGQTRIVPKIAFQTGSGLHNSNLTPIPDPNSHSECGFSQRLQLRDERLGAYDAGEPAAKRVDRSLLHRHHAELFAGDVPVLDGKSHRPVDDEVHRVTKIGRDARSRLAALLHLNARDREAADAKREQLGLQRSPGERVARVLEDHGLALAHGDEVHEAQVNAIAFEARVTIGMQKEDDR